LVLGVVQGLAEFLPISSSAHLVLVPWLLSWPEHSLTYDVALHMGTLAALLGYFWRDWWRLLRAWLPDQRASLTAVNEEDLTAGVHSAALDRRLGITLVVGTIPAAIIGAALGNTVETALHIPFVIGLLLIAGGVLLAAADRAGIKQYGLETITYGQAAAIGVAQALALAPGVSRSGVTLAAALFLGLTREAGARFSFLLSAPITAGAGLFQLRHLLKGGIPANERAAFVIGVAGAFLVGMATIGGLLRYLRERNLDVFVWYRVVVGLLVVLIALTHLR
jgi:undecaprenyl-diphosphatase